MKTSIVSGTASGTATIKGIVDQLKGEVTVRIGTLAPSVAAGVVERKPAGERFFARTASCYPPSRTRILCRARSGRKSCRKR